MAVMGLVLTDAALCIVGGTTSHGVGHSYIPFVVFASVREKKELFSPLFPSLSL
jgi:hypothetical protein